MESIFDQNMSHACSKFLNNKTETESDVWNLPML